MLSYLFFSCVRKHDTLSDYLNRWLRRKGRRGHSSSLDLQSQEFLFYIFLPSIFMKDPSSWVASLLLCASTFLWLDWMPTQLTEIPNALLRKVQGLMSIVSWTEWENIPWSFKVEGNAHMMHQLTSCITPYFPVTYSVHLLLSFLI